MRNVNLMMIPRRLDFALLKAPPRSMILTLSTSQFPKMPEL